MPTSDKHIHQNVPSCTILRNIFELISPTHCSTMQIYTHETKNRSPPPPPHITSWILPFNYPPPLSFAEFGQFILKFRYMQSVPMVIF